MGGSFRRKMPLPSKQDIVGSSPIARSYYSHEGQKAFLSQVVYYWVKKTIPSNPPLYIIRARGAVVSAGDS